MENWISVEVYAGVRHMGSMELGKYARQLRTAAGVAVFASP